MKGYRAVALSETILSHLDTLKGSASYNAFLMEHFQLGEVGRKRKYPFSELAVGESFLQEFEDTHIVDGSPTYNRLKTARQYWENKTGFKFRIRPENSSLRVTRIK